MDSREWPVRPVVVCSRCLGFESCRYNGQMLRDDTVEALRPHVDFITPCPEADIGLGIPRHPVRIVVKDGAQRLFQPATGEDHTEEMRRFVSGFSQGLGSVDGFILKSRSPSCGLTDVKQFRADGVSLVTGRGSGIFGSHVLSVHGGCAVEDEGRLHNGKIRDHFFRKLFTLADFRRVAAAGDAGELVDFQSRNKLLLMAYSQAEMRRLGRIVAEQKATGLDAALKEYEEHLRKAMEKGATYRSNINVMQHAFGYVSRELSSEERAFFLDSLEMYREGRTPLVNCLGLLRSWIVRFDVEYLAGQTYFNPYPEDLHERYDQNRSRDYWK